MLPVLLSLLACTPSDTDTGDGVQVDTLGIALRDQGWLRGDLHMHTTHSDGFEDVATLIAIAESWASEDFVAFRPEFEGNHLDFIAITDHRTVSAQDDPDYHSDALVLVGSEEFGSRGHANTPGAHVFVDHDPGDDGVTIEDIEAGIAAAHDQGALFSPNHPFLFDIPFPWDVTGFDTMELWNAGWALGSTGMTPELLDQWEASGQPVSETYHRAVQHQGGGSSAQSLVWYEAMLARGEHVGLVGGSDRHALLMPGAPTTWVLGDSVDEAGIVQGMRQRHTFVSRHPAAAQLLVEVEHGGSTWMQGDAIPLDGATAQVRTRVGRAAGGRLQIIAGEAVSGDDLATATLGEVVAEVDVDSNDFEYSLELPVQEGTWAYALVLEPLVAPGLDADQEQLVRDTALAVAQMNAEEYLDLAMALAPFIPEGVIGEPASCDVDDWQSFRFQCNPADTEGVATFWSPDALDRAFNATTEEGQLTDWSMGAVASAVLFSTAQSP